MESKHNTKDSHQITREQEKKGEKKAYKNKSKTINKMEIGTMRYHLTPVRMAIIKVYK